jgi:AGCS family alanine or glycine:cation symporter
MIPGPNFVQQAIDSTFSGFGSIFVAFAVLLFAFTSQVFFYYVATTNLIFLLGEKRNRVLEGTVKIGALAIAFIGSVISADAIWAVGDIGYALLAWMNMIAVVLLTPVVRRIVRDYDAQRKAGVDPVFTPGDLGITGATWWENEFLERRASGADPAVTATAAAPAEDTPDDPSPERALEREAQ